MYQIFVVEDELLIRQNIRNIIESMPGPFAFCGEASDGEMALSVMQELMPDILLTDIRMPFLDGFELIRHAKNMMPWLKTAIISGYDDFEYARRAISLGVDQYLLKPVRAPELAKAVETMARQIEESRLQNTLPQGYDRDELQLALRRHFMHGLLYGNAAAGTLLEQARALQLDIISPLYQSALFYFDSEDADQALLRAAVRSVLSRLDLPLYYFSDPQHLTLLCLGTEADTLNEQVYRSINILRHELNALCPVITTVVSSAVSRLSAVGDACRAASSLLKKISGVSAGQVIDAGDTAPVTAKLMEFSSPFGGDFHQKLQTAEPADVPRLLDEMLASPAGEQFNSMLLRHYALVELLKLTVQTLSRAAPGADSKDVAAKLGAQYDIFAASGRLETFRQTAIDLLQRALSIRQESLGSLKYRGIVSRAEKYVAENFCDPNISLISVAKHVGMSSAHFSTVFSQTLGRSFINYLTAMRIERAKELLSGTGMKLSAIAMEIGYNEPNYFSHVFRKVEGITPKEYRNRFSVDPPQ